MVSVREATRDDLAAVAAIYAHEAEHAISTFDVEGRPVTHWAEKLDSSDPFLVATSGAHVVGYAYAGTYRPRPAYAGTREVSVYLDQQARGQGAGTALYADLLDRLRSSGMRTALAVIALPNDASERLHVSFGFSSVGVLCEVGRKFDRWIDTALYQLIL